ncbi:MAG: pyridoxal phosphate-dependent aminotransferase [Ancalomicrobiaceae bacterium]|nr:pyridoxal phosphate-dependent aminotransferase [Ancalomicrobiaceae bacterium]
MSIDLTQFISRIARETPGSEISAVADYGRARPSVIPLWVGEADLPTPRFICDAATRSLAAGETFYTGTRGIAELRQALAAYHARLYGGSFSPERFFVTGSGMQSIQVALTLVAGAGDEVIVPTPAWPNFAAAVGVRGARPRVVPMRFGNAGWVLDLDDLAAAINANTRAIYFNSPCNPTGWTASRDELTRVLDLARRHGLWIVADEVYTRFVYDGTARAPSFHDVAEPDDRILYTNTFSKNWAMTGWRVGWIEADPSLGGAIENLLQYSTSGVAVFMQRGAVAALEQGEGFVEHLVARVRRNRNLVSDAFAKTPRIRFSNPAGAFYMYFAIDGEPDTARLPFRLMDEIGIGLAPGGAFGAAGNGFLRLCFARSAESVAEAVDRLTRWVAETA